MTDKESESVNGFGKIGGESGSQLWGGGGWGLIVLGICRCPVLSERLPHYSPFFGKLWTSSY